MRPVEIAENSVIAIRSSMSVYPAVRVGRIMFTPA
jgi:hypothetical protein